MILRRPARPMLGLALAAAAAAALQACSAPAGEDATPDPAGTAAPSGAAMADIGAELPSVFVRTAWRVEAEDGARYVTYLDPDGRYRDLRNGDPWQTGTWENDASEKLCFLPDAEGGVRRCWQPDRMQSEKAMIATGEDGNRIRLRRVDYVAPAAQASAAAE